MATSHPEFPARLVDGDDAAAALLARVLAEPNSGPTEQQSWQRLKARERRAWLPWLAPALALGFAATAWLVWPRSSAPTLSVAPEVLARSTAAAPLVAQPPSDADKSLERLPEPTPRPRGQPSARREDSAADCSPLAKSGQYREAAACYGKVAHGNRMDAELALYEKARLEAKALGQSALALTTLDEHARRFPEGVLATEVQLTRIELLTQLGRRVEALQAIEHGLRGSLGRERGGDLQVLRADLLSSNGDCEAALAAARLAREAGVHASRLKGTEQRCPAATGAP